jgi:hypothetical protein
MSKKLTRRAAKPSMALARRRADLQAQVQDEPGVIGVFSRLARDPKLTVEKLATLVDLQLKIKKIEAETAFDLAYELMQPEIPIISRRGKVLNKQGGIQSRYSKYEDIRKVTDPIIRRFGFHVHFATTWPETGVLEVIGYLTHKAGHTRESRFRSKADASGGKNEIQGLGSGVQYGRRYTLKDLLAIVEEGQDDDGQAHGRVEARREPEARREEPRREPVPEPAHGHHSRSRERITEGQVKRLGVIIHNSGRSPEEIQPWMERRYGFKLRKEITNDKYDAICSAIEAPGDLP